MPRLFLIAGLQPMMPEQRRDRLERSRLLLLQRRGHALVQGLALCHQQAVVYRFLDDGVRESVFRIVVAQDESLVAQHPEVRLDLRFASLDRKGVAQQRGGKRRCRPRWPLSP